MSKINLSAVQVSAVRVLCAIATGSEGLSKVLMAVIRKAVKGAALADINKVYDSARSQLMASLSPDDAKKAIERHAIQNCIAKARRVAEHVDLNGLASIGETSSVTTAADRLSKAAKRACAPNLPTGPDGSDAEGNSPAEVKKAKDEAKAKVSAEDAINALAEGDAEFADAMRALLGSATGQVAFIAWVKAGMHEPQTKPRAAKARKAA